MRVVIVADAAERAEPDFGERAHRAFHAAMHDMAKGAAPPNGERVEALDELVRILDTAHAEALKAVMG